MASDGIKFLIDLDSRTTGASAAAAALNQVADSAAKADQHLEKMGSHGTGLSRDVFKAEFAMEALKEGAHLAWEGVELLKETIIDTIKTAAGEQRERIAFENILGPDGGREAIEYLDKFSELSEYTEDQVKGFGAELLRAGYRGQEFEDAMAAIADSASMSMDKVGGAQEALASLTRMRMTGKLDARTLKGLRLDAHEVTNDLAEALGMTPEAVKKGLEAGTIPAARAYSIVLDALERKTGKRLGEAGLQAGEGLEAKLAHLKELPEKIMKGVSGSAGMKMLESGFDKILEAFSPDSPGGQAAIAGLSQLMEKVGEAVNGVDWSTAGEKVRDITEMISKWIDPLSKVVGLLAKVAEGLLGLPTLVDDIGDWAVRKLHPELDQTPTHIREARMRREKELQKQNDEGASELPVYVPPELRRRIEEIPSFNMVQPRVSSGTVNEGHTVNTVVNVHGDVKDPKSVADAASKGVEHGMTTANEKAAAMAGVRAKR